MVNLISLLEHITATLSLSKKKQSAIWDVQLPGLRGIRLREEDYVVGAALMKEDQEVLVITEKGYGKRTKVSEYPVKGRGGKGIKTANITEKMVH